MSLLSDKISYLRAETGLDLRLADDIGDENANVVFPIIFYGEKHALSLPKKDESAAKVVSTYFADADYSYLQKSETLLYKLFSLTATVDEIERLDKILGDKKYFVVILKTDGADKRAELMNYVGAILGKEDILTRANGGEAVLIKRADGGYSSADELSDVLYDGITEERKIDLRVGSGGSATGTNGVLNAFGRAYKALKLCDEKVAKYRDCAFTDMIKNTPYVALREYCDFITDGKNFILDDELKLTAREFFNCGLSVSEAARKLYVHRNTLQKRLDKIKDITGLDLRSYREAQLFDCVLAILSAIDTYEK